MQTTLPNTTTAYNLTVKLIWKEISALIEGPATLSCDHRQFYLSIPGVARFLACPEDNCIVIEKASPEINDTVINTWLLGTVFAYVLQYHGYLVLHGSAVLMKGRAVIFSGESGAGKSTLAGAFLNQGYSLITDDLVVIKRRPSGQYQIIPGPAQLKLWKDALYHLNQDINHAIPVNLKIDKYSIPITHVSNEPTIPISAFYELNIAQSNDAFRCERLNATQSLRTLIQNAYRYFMLKPLGKLQTFFQDCSVLSQHLAVHKLTRTPHFSDLPKIMQHIESTVTGK